jgi:uncharacterized membrane protein
MDVRGPIELVAVAFEAAGILVLVLGAALGAVAGGTALVRREARSGVYQAFRRGLGQAILLGLEFLVAADIIRSVALDFTFVSVGILGLLVLIRTFLSWSIEVEIEGEWPWRRARSSAQASG